MKNKILQKILKLLTKGIIKKYNPKIIGITGSVGKTSTKDALYQALKDSYRVRKSAGNLNTELGAPLAFIGYSNSPTKNNEWLKIILKGVKEIIIKNKNYPKIIISELAADKPGDIKYLTNFIQPDIGIVTAIGEIPVHIEFYKNSMQVAEEKSHVLLSIKNNGLAVINRDDPHYQTLNKAVVSNTIKAKTFGFKNKADVQILDYKILENEESQILLRHKNKDHTVILKNCYGESFAYICSSVFAVCVSLKISPKKIIKSLQNLKPSLGRLYKIEGINNSIILDSSYNAAPLSMKSSLETLDKFPGKRKLAVIGDMLELGKFSEKEHQKIGEIAAKTCDYLFFVGEKREILKNSALKAGLQKDKIFTFKKSNEVTKILKKIITSGDVILIKGSQGVRTERVVYEIMKNKEQAGSLLVRQTNYWKNKN